MIMKKHNTLRNYARLNPISLIVLFKGEIFKYNKIQNDITRPNRLKSLDLHACGMI